MKMPMEESFADRLSAAGVAHADRLRPADRWIGEGRDFILVAADVLKTWDKSRAEACATRLTRATGNQWLAEICRVVRLAGEKVDGDRLFDDICGDADQVRARWAEVLFREHDAPKPGSAIDIRAARGALGSMWGLDRPLHMSELGRLLRLQGRDPGATVRDWERGKSPVSGPASVAIEAMLSGWQPPHWRETLRTADQSS